MSYFTRLMKAVNEYTASTHPFAWWLLCVILVVYSFTNHDHFERAIGSLGALIAISTMAILIAIRRKP